MRLRNPESTDRAACIRKHDITRRDFAHGLIKCVECTVPFCLRRPNVIPAEFVSKRLLMVNPPVAHVRGVDTPMQSLSRAPDAPQELLGRRSQKRLIRKKLRESRQCAQFVPESRHSVVQ
jgi:hypothetical protein